MTDTEKPLVAEYTAHIKELYLRGDIDDQDMRVVLDDAVGEWESDMDEWFRSELMQRVIRGANK